MRPVWHQVVGLADAPVDPGFLGEARDHRRKGVGQQHVVMVQELREFALRARQREVPRVRQAHLPAICRVARERYGLEPLAAGGGKLAPMSLSAAHTPPSAGRLRSGSPGGVAGTTRRWGDVACVLTRSRAPGP